MEISKLLNTLEGLSDKNDKRVDKYLSEMKKFLKESGEYHSEKHDIIFDHMVKQVNTSNRIKKIALSIGGLAICMTFYLLFSDMLIDLKYKKESGLLELIRSKNLFLKFNPSSTENILLNLVPDTNIQEVNNLFSNDTNFGSVGKYYGLGSGANLHAFRNPSNKDQWRIYPLNNDTTQTIGYIKLKTTYGFNELNRVPAYFNTPIEHRTLDQLCIRVVDVMRTSDSDSTNVVWQIQYGEKSGSDILWQQNVIHVEQSKRGERISTPHYIANKDWKSSYIVTVGVGKYGRTESKEMAWNLRSYAYEVRIN